MPAGCDGLPASPPYPPKDNASLALLRARALPCCERLLYDGGSFSTSLPPLRHPACARRIALAGRRLVETYLEPRLGTSCYWATLLRGLGDKLPFDARGSPDEGAIEAAEFLDRIQV